MSISLKKGFTLVELMIVIGIIGILSASLYPSLSRYLARGRDTQKIAELKQLDTALIVYRIDTGLYYVPGTGLNGLGRGIINFTNGTTYTKSLFIGLQELGYIRTGIKQKLATSFNTPYILTNIAPCATHDTPGANSVGQDSYMYYFDGSTGQYALSAYLENPKQGDIDNIVVTIQGIEPYGTCTRYGMNYAIGQN